MGGSHKLICPTMVVHLKKFRHFFHCYFLLLILLNRFGACDAYFYSDTSEGDNRNCFCELKGSIDDCSCNVDTVDYFNNNKIYPRLKSLLVRDFFRFYKINLKKDCPFWTDDSKCAMRTCHVMMCEDKDLPDGFKKHSDSETAAYKYLAENQKNTGCGGSSGEDHNDELSYLNKTITQEAKHGFAVWADFDEQQDNFCILDDHENGAEYVDLLLNPERYTGYKGKSAHRIWRSIYLENCFDPNSQHGLSGQRTFVTHLNKLTHQLNNMCFEQRAFYRLLSGLHSSINIHLCSDYLLSEKKSFMTMPNGEWGRNNDEFRNRFSPETTNGEGPNWLKNLYFIYLLEMRALSKAANYLRNDPYFTGNDDEDESVRVAVADILNIIESFPSHFNESLMFNGTTAAELKSDFREKFRNISRIMDCVGCEKCRLWGKLQVQGLGTALKILFSGKFDRIPTDKAEELDGNNGFKLRRSEIVALFNAFGRLSNSINQLEEFREVTR